MVCRSCSNTPLVEILDLGMAPPSNQLQAAGTDKAVNYLPLKVMVCDACWLIQTLDFAQADDLFEEDYVYLSSTSSSWLTHCEMYASQMIAALDLNNGSFVVELASNDGYMLKNFVDAGIPCLGIEPTELAATIAKNNGVETLIEFFGVETAKSVTKSRGKADLIIGNNVLAHVPDIKDFVAGVSVLLEEDGSATFEFPYAKNLFDGNQYDTVYHEHFSYLSVISTTRLFQSVGLDIYNIEHIPTHGGSLRLFVSHGGKKEIQPICDQMLADEKKMGLDELSFYLEWAPRVLAHKLEVTNYLIEKAKEGKQIFGYGAAAKGNTLLNYCGIRQDVIRGIYDNAVSKIGKLSPGSHIPILDPKVSDLTQADVIIIFPWNISEELLEEIKSYELKSDVEIVKLIPSVVRLNS